MRWAHRQPRASAPSGKILVTAGGLWACPSAGRAGGRALFAAVCETSRPPLGFPSSDAFLLVALNLQTPLSFGKAQACSLLYGNAGVSLQNSKDSFLFSL